MAIPIPSSDGTLIDGGLSVQPEDASNVFALVGSCSGGVAGTIYTYRGVDTQQVKTDLVSGPLCDSVIDHLVKSGGKTTYAYKATATTAGASGTVTRVGTSPTVTLSNPPVDAFENIVKIILGGTVGTATFQYSVDNGDTWSPTYTTAATFVLPTGVTINFTAGTYVAGDTETWLDTAPTMSSANISAALDDLIASALDFDGVHVVGQPPDAATLLTIATMCDGKVTTAFAAKKPFIIYLEAPAVDKATLIAAFPSFTSNFVSIAAGFLEYVNLRTGAVEKRSAGRPYVARVARVPISVDPSRNPTDSDLEAIVGAKVLVPPLAAASTGYHDEGSTPGLNAARFTSLMHVTGRPGFYVTNGLTMAATTSDYQLIQLARIGIRGWKLFYLWSLTNLSARLKKDLKTGYIATRVADALEDGASSFLSTAMSQHVDGIRVLFNRSDDLSASNILRGKIRFVGPAYAKNIAWDMGFATALS